MTKPVLSELDDGVRTIMLNRPERLNAMSLDLVATLADELAAANADPDTRVMILTGSGRAFCAGDDLKEPLPPEEPVVRAFIDDIQRATREIVLGRTFVVGAINGWAVGGGMELALDCDLPIWAESAQGFFPEMGWGAFVTGAVTVILPNLVGLAKAKDMILRGERYSAAELLELGVAWRVVPDEQLMQEACIVAREIAALPQRSVADLKRVMAKAAFGDVETAIALEAEATVQSFLDPETLERMQSFESGRSQDG